MDSWPSRKLAWSPKPTAPLMHGAPHRGEAHRREQAGYLLAELHLHRLVEQLQEGWQKRLESLHIDVPRGTTD
jgi:hypothetical protein